MYLVLEVSRLNGAFCSDWPMGNTFFVFNCPFCNLAKIPFKLQFGNWPGFFYPPSRYEGFFFLFQFLVRPTHIVIERQEKDIWRTSGRPLPTGDMQGKGKHVPKKSEIVKAQREKKERENPLTFPLYGTYEYVRTCVCNFRTIAPSPLLHFLTLADLRMP